jgi:MerR family transcriptional regulator/heat shock protein HspR
MRTARSKTLKGSRTKEEVSKILRINIRELKELEEEGLFEFADRAKQLIDHKNFERLRVAVSLKRDLGVNNAGLDVILNMREKMTKMRTEMNDFLAEVRKKLKGKLSENADKLSRE